MDQVKIQAAVAAHGLSKGQKTDDWIAETPVIAGGIRNGVFIELDRRSGADTGNPGCAEPGCILDEGHDGIDPDVHTDDHPVDTSDPDEPTRGLVDVDLPDPDDTEPSDPAADFGSSTDDGETAMTYRHSSEA